MWPDRGGGAWTGGAPERPLGMQQSSPPEPEESRSRTNLVFLIVAVLVVVAGVWLVNKLIDMRNLQNCLESGRRDCVPIETPSR